jgi:hypothetical protein
MHRGRPVGESFNHCPPGWIGQSSKRGTQFIHNRMVVDYRAMSRMDFVMADFCSAGGPSPHCPFPRRGHPLLSWPPQFEGRVTRPRQQRQKASPQARPLAMSAVSTNCQMSLGPSLPLAPCYHSKAEINKGQTSLPSGAHNKGSAWSCTASPHGPVWTRSLASQRWPKRIGRWRNYRISQLDASWQRFGDKSLT